MISYSTNEYGLREVDMRFMLHAFESLPTLEKVILFGSRALGKYQNGSDVDLALIGNITNRDIATIVQTLENESPGLLSFDIVVYNSINNAALKHQIDTHGKVIYPLK